MSFDLNFVRIYKILFRNAEFLHNLPHRNRRPVAVFFKTVRRIEEEGIIFFDFTQPGKLFRRKNDRSGLVIFKYDQLILNLKAVKNFGSLSAIELGYWNEFI